MCKEEKFANVKEDTFVIFSKNQGSIKCIYDWLFPEPHISQWNTVLIDELFNGRYCEGLKCIKRTTDKEVIKNIIREALLTREHVLNGNSN